MSLFKGLLKKKDISSKYNWSIVFLKNDIPQYKMLSENIVKMVGYYMIKIGNSKNIIDPWSLEVIHYKSGKKILLSKHFFPNPDKINENLFKAIENIDPNYEDVSTQADVVFIDCLTGKKIPLSLIHLPKQGNINYNNQTKTFFDILNSLLD